MTSDTTAPAVPTAADAEATTAPAPAAERFPELAALEEEIRRRLRSNRRFLEQCLDEEFVDDEDDDEEEEESEEEL